MKNIRNLVKQIFSIKNSKEFEEIAINTFNYQSKINPIYKKYIDFLNLDINKINKITDIPFLPIEFFKTHIIISENLKEQKVFLSSGTTMQVQSKHYVADLKIYEKSFINAFNLFYGNIQDYCILALLPNYLEREGSSLIYMVKGLMNLSNFDKSGFYLYDHDKLVDRIMELKAERKKYILIGVSYALLDMASSYELDLSDGIVIETGGMKGKRKEMLKEEMHQILKQRFNLNEIHSEYGMTELLSQAYSKGSGLFQTPPWMKVLIRDTYDPFSYLSLGSSGGINVIDLANIYSCSFIETKDLGRMQKNGLIEVLGRFDNSDIRGCNLLIN